MFQSLGPSSFFLMVFKSFVHQSCFISQITPDEDVIVMADEFWRQFYGKNFKGGQSTLCLGDRLWNVKMDGLTDSCVFTHGCSEMVNDLSLDRRSTFVFSMVGNKVFELLVFNHQTGTQIQNNSVELVVLDDSIYGDDGDDLEIASEHKEKCSTGVTDFQEGVVVKCEDDKFQLATFESVFNVDPKGKTNVFVEDRSMSSIVVSDAMPKCKVDVGQFVVPKKKKAMRKSKVVMLVSDESHIAHRTRSKFTKKNESVVVDSMTPAETTSVRSITHTSDVVSH
ncbi:putative transcription factor B3-Domain family [Helianthus annuus]|nr:putative transcription factor B3-Domain family [Helianthus annuus]